MLPVGVDVDVVGDFRFAFYTPCGAVADLRVRHGHFAADDVGDMVLKPSGRRHFRIDEEGVEILHDRRHRIRRRNWDAAGQRAFGRQLAAAAAADLEIFDFHVSKLVVDGEIDTMEGVVDGCGNIAEDGEFLPFRREFAFNSQAEILPRRRIQHDVVDDGGRCRAASLERQRVEAGLQLDFLDLQLEIPIGRTNLRGLPVGVAVFRLREDRIRTAGVFSGPAIFTRNNRFAKRLVVFLPSGAESFVRSVLFLQPRRPLGDEFRLEFGRKLLQIVAKIRDHRVFVVQFDAHDAGRFCITNSRDSVYAPQ